MSTSRKDYFIIYTLARTGSTKIAALFNHFEANCCLSEPFNYVVHREKYLDIVYTSGMQDCLREIRQNYRGIKHVCHIAWPFPAGSKYNDELLLESNSRILLLYRENRLKRIVSEMIAQQSSIWHVKSDYTKIQREEFQYSALSMDEIESLLLLDQQLLCEAREKLSKNRIQWMEVSYESLFESLAFGCETGRKVLEILKFCQIVTEKTGSPSEDECAALLKQDANKFSDIIYDKIPNIKEVELRFGSPEHGFLFRDKSIV